jgi:1-acyl-sn-glycerol-3-phosphate acyltransferase
MAEVKNKDGLGRRIWHEFWRFISVGLVWLMYRVTVYGKENIPRQGAAVILSNHQSFLDIMLCQGWLRRPLYFVPRDTLFVGFWGWMIDSFYTIPINQDKPGLQSMKAIIDILKRGHIVCLYPEGSRTLDGKIAEIKPGFSLLVRRSGAPIIPMVVDGVYERWPRGQKFPKLGGRVGVMYGTPIPADRIKNLGEEKFIAEFNQTLQTMHNALRRKMGKEPYAYEA